MLTVSKVSEPTAPRGNLAALVVVVRAVSESETSSWRLLPVAPSLMDDGSREVCSSKVRPVVTILVCDIFRRSSKPLCFESSVRDRFAFWNRKSCMRSVASNFSTVEATTGPSYVKLLVAGLLASDVAVNKKKVCSFVKLQIYVLQDNGKPWSLHGKPLRKGCGSQLLITTIRNRLHFSNVSELRCACSSGTEVCQRLLRPWHIGITILQARKHAKPCGTNWQAIHNRVV